MTQAAVGRTAEAGVQPVGLWRVAAFALSVFILLIYSQAWVYPLLGDTADAAAGGLVRVLYLPAYAAGIALLAMAPRSAILALMRQPFLVLLLAIAAASWFWSISPDQTSRRVFALYCTTLGAVVIAARYRWAKLAEVMGTCFAILVLLTFVVALAVPSLGQMRDLFPGAWRGPWPEKNALGGNMAVAFSIFAAAAALNPHRARLWSGFAVLALVLVLLSTSKTSLLALLLAFGGVMFVALARRGPAAGVVMVWGAVLALVLAAGVWVFASDVVFEILGKDATLTGRTKIWAAVMRQIEERPWLGYGYATIWDEKGIWTPLAWIVKDAGFKPVHAHNAWLEQWLGMGILGLTAFALAYAQVVLTALISMFRSPGAYLAVPFLLVYSLMSLTESIAVTYNDLRWVLFVAIAVKLAWPDRKAAD